MCNYTTVSKDLFNFIYIVDNLIIINNDRQGERDNVLCTCIYITQ